MQNELMFNALLEQSQETGRWLAVCLELNIVVEGNKPEEAQKNLQDAVDMYVESVFEEGDFESLHRPAPKKYWDKIRPAKPSVHLISA